MCCCKPVVGKIITNCIGTPGNSVLDDHFASGDSSRFTPGIYEATEGYAVQNSLWLSDPEPPVTIGPLRAVVRHCSLPCDQGPWPTNGIYQVRGTYRGLRNGVNDPIVIVDDTDSVGFGGFSAPLISLTAVHRRLAGAGTEADAVISYSGAPIPAIPIAYDASGDISVQIIIRKNAVDQYQLDFFVNGVLVHDELRTINDSAMCTGGGVSFATERDGWGNISNDGTYGIDRVESSVNWV